MHHNAGSIVQISLFDSTNAPVAETVLEGETSEDLSALAKEAMVKGGAVQTEDGMHHAYPISAGEPPQVIGRRCHVLDNLGRDGTCQALINSAS